MKKYQVINDSVAKLDAKIINEKNEKVFPNLALFLTSNTNIDTLKHIYQKILIYPNNSAFSGPDKELSLINEDFIRPGRTEGYVEFFNDYMDEEGIDKEELAKEDLISIIEQWITLVEQHKTE